MLVVVFVTFSEWFFGGFVFYCFFYGLKQKQHKITAVGFSFAFFFHGDEDGDVFKDSRLSS